MILGVRRMTQITFSEGMEEIQIHSSLNGYFVQNVQWLRHCTFTPLGDTQTSHSLKCRALQMPSEQKAQLLMFVTGNYTALLTGQLDECS